jgi:hypothetical protein
LTVRRHDSSVAAATCSDKKQSSPAPGPPAHPEPSRLGALPRGGWHSTRFVRGGDAGDGEHGVPRVTAPSAGPRALLSRMARESDFGSA